MTRSTPATPLARRRSALGAALLGASLFSGLTALSACSAGQITQTDTQVASVPGVNASSADGNIAVRDVVLAYAPKYEPGATVPIVLRVFNNSDKLVRITAATSQRGPVVLVGSPSATPSVTPSATPSGSSSNRPSGSPSGSASPSASPSPTPTVVGASRFQVDVPVRGFQLLTPETKTYLAIAPLSGSALMAGQSVPVTLNFAYADGTSTIITDLNVPVSVPLSPIPRQVPSAVGAG